HNLTQRGNVAVRDPEVSYDGQRVVFAMRAGADLAKWQVYEIGVDGTGLRRISKNASHNDMDPAYLPDGRIVFTTDRLRWSDGYENVPATQVAVMNGDGTAVEVLKVNTAGHLNPLIGSDGRLYMTQWDFHDRRRDFNDPEDRTFDVNRFLLWQIFVDGSGLDHPSFGAHTIGDFTPGYVEIRELPTAPGQFVGTLGSEDTQELTSFVAERLIFVPGNFLTFEGAELVKMVPQPDQLQDAPIYLAREEEPPHGLWRAPLPLQDGRIVASYTPDIMENRGLPEPFELWIMDGDGGNKQRLYQEDGQWCLQAVEVVARTPPAIATGQVRPLYPYAVINALDVNLRGSDPQPHPAPGQAVELRVYREDVRTENQHDQQLEPDVVGTDPFAEWNDPDTAFLGTAPIHGDGSFAVVVPVDTPLTWEVVDSSGQVIVRERFGAELRRGELRQCAGCHAPHDGTTGSTTNFALDSPTNLTNENIDLDGNGVFDLVESLCENNPGLCIPALFTDGFETGDTTAWSPDVP
ncbi:MAG: hypothetical protein MI919_07050, partial [Holophagales bacterium]|nr:hypothetical protein [Holophagales bacterium]